MYNVPPEDVFPFVWEPDSHPALEEIKRHYSSAEWLRRVSVLWSQESNRANSNADIRSENFNLIRVLGSSITIVSGQYLTCRTLQQRLMVQITWNKPSNSWM